jgi:carboxyl-terminal processing protease
MSIQALKEELEKMDASSEALTQLKKLESDILEDKARQYTIHKDKLIDLIEQEITGRYYFQEGTTKQRLKKDPELQEAIELLNSSRRYKEILS